MSKPKNPLLSFGARGTIADSLTFQRRGKLTIAESIPIPTDRKSPAQLIWRQIYRNAVATWHALSPEEKEAWRGVCPGLSPYQCFMKSELKYPPPPPPIYIGADAITRETQILAVNTVITKDGPANATGMLHTVKVYAREDMTGFIAGTFYTTNGNRLKCRDSELIGDVEAGAERTFTGLSIAVEEGDYIGCFFDTGTIERDKDGFAGVWYKPNQWIDPGDEADYSLLTNDALSLNGIGEPGGGGGNQPQEDEIMLKSGQSTAPAKTETQVDFTTPFTGTPSVVFVAYAENDTPYLLEVTPTYFKWNNASKFTPVTIDWVATDRGNP